MIADSVDFVAGNDPLLRDAHAHLSIEIPVLGLTTRFESNSRHVMDAVEQAFGAWRVVECPASDAPPFLVRIIVHGGAEGVPHPVPVRHISPDGNRMIVQTPGSVAIADPLRRESLAYVTRELAANCEHFREALLEAATLALLSGFDRHPLHASAIARHGHAVLLSGPSGAGKSTLAHLAHTAGADVLSEDRVWLQRESSMRVWGWPGYARLLTPGNTSKRVVPLPTSGAASYSANTATVCILARGSVAGLERIDTEAIREALVRDVAPGFDRFPERHAACAAALASPGGWKLTLSPDPTDALPLLEQMLSARN